MIRVRLHVITSMIRQKKSKQPGACYQEISKFDKKKIGVTKDTLDIALPKSQS